MARTQFITHGTSRVIIEIAGVEVAAKVRRRDRRDAVKARDIARAEHREFKRDREYA